MGILNGNIPLHNLRFQDDKLPTDTSIEQVNTAENNMIMRKRTDPLKHLSEKNRRDSFRKVCSLCTQ